MSLKFTFVSALLILSATAFAADSSTNDAFSIDLTPDNSAIEPQSKPPQSTVSQSQSPISTAIQNLNPDISLLGDFLAGNREALRLRNEPVQHPAYLREVEMDAAGYISPYAKGFFVLSVNGSGEADIEEAYMNFFELPGTFALKLGKMLVDTDTLNPQHLHAFPFVERPLMEHHEFGEEGLKQVGANLSFLVPNPWDHYILLSGTAGPNMNNDQPDSALFNGGAVNTWIYTARLSTSFDLTDISYVTFNATSLTAPLRDGSRTQMFMGDMLLRIVPNPFSNAVSVLSGYLWDKGNPDQTSTFVNHGFYGYAGWQFSPRWRIGSRYDQTDFKVYGKEKQIAGILSFYPTETNYVRLQYARHQLPDPLMDHLIWEHRVWLQVDFTLGPHQAHAAL